jgi:hypothetical protein
MSEPHRIQWTSYARRRCAQRGFQLDILESLLRTSTERYSDVDTGRRVVVGRHDALLVLIAYETGPEDVLVPVTVHTTTRAQVQARLLRGRYHYA